MDEETTQDQVEPTGETTPDVETPIDTGTDAGETAPPAEVVTPTETVAETPTTQSAVPSDDPVYTPPPELAEIEAEIDKIDPLDPDSVKAALKKTLGIAAQATQRASVAEKRSQAANVVAERELAFKAASRSYGVSKTEAEKLYDEQVAKLAKAGFKGDDLIIRATARWEMALEQRKDQPAPKAKAASPATPVTRGGAAALPRGATGSSPPPPAKPIGDRVRSGDYGALENL